MSGLRPALNAYLRWAERPVLEKAQDPVRLRMSFERKARLLFYPPLGAKRRGIDLAGIPALEVACGVPQDRVLLYFHGGAYVFGSPRTHWAMLARLCKTAGARAVLPEYRKAPEHPHPAALEDARTAYLHLIASGIASGQIVLGGDSAGGGLALALLGALIAEGQALPGACFAFSPLTDLTYGGASVQSNAASDVVLPASRMTDLREMFMGTQDPRDPLASPLFAAFDGAPPVWLTASDSEILLDDSRRMAAHLRAAGVEAAYEEVHDLPHVWPIFQTILPEARETLNDLGAWIKRTVPTQAGS